MYGNNIGAIPNKLVIIPEAVYAENMLVDGDIRPVNVNLFHPGMPVYEGDASLDFGDNGELFRGGEVLPTSYYALIDKYNYIIKYGAVRTLEAQASMGTNQRFTPVVSGTTSIYSTKGLFNFTDLALYAEPGRTHTIEVVFEGNSVPTKTTLSVPLRK